MRDRIYWWAHKDGRYASGSLHGPPGSAESLGIAVEKEAKRIGADDWAWSMSDMAPAWFVTADTETPEDS